MVFAFLFGLVLGLLYSAGNFQAHMVDFVSLPTVPRTGTHPLPKTIPCPLKTLGCP